MKKENETSEVKPDVQVGVAPLRPSLDDGTIAQRNSTRQENDPELGQLPPKRRRLHCSVDDDRRSLWKVAQRAIKDAGLPIQGKVPLKQLPSSQYQTNKVLIRGKTLQGQRDAMRRCISNGGSDEPHDDGELRKQLKRIETGRVSNGRTKKNKCRESLTTEEKPIGSCTETIEWDQEPSLAKTGGNPVNHEMDTGIAETIEVHQEHSQGETDGNPVNDEVDSRNPNKEASEQRTNLMVSRKRKKRRKKEMCPKYKKDWMKVHEFKTWTIEDVEGIKEYYYTASCLCSIDLCTSGISFHSPRSSSDDGLVSRRGLSVRIKRPKAICSNAKLTNSNYYLIVMFTYNNLLITMSSLLCFFHISLCTR